MIMGMVAMHSSVVTTLMEPAYSPSLLYTWAIWVTAEAEGVMAERKLTSRMVSPSGTRRARPLYLSSTSTTSGYATICPGR